MKFSIGDPVFIKTNNEEGVILEWIDDSTVKVRAGKATYHVFTEDIEHPYLRWFLNKEKKPEKIFSENIKVEKNSKTSGLPEGMHIAFFPQYTHTEFEDNLIKVKVYLYNETSNEYSFYYSCKNKNETYFEIENELLSQHEFYIHDLSFEHMASSPVFQYRFTDKKDSSLELEHTFTLKPKKLYEYLDKVKYDNHAFFSIPLFEKIEAKPYQHIDVANISIKQSQASKRNHFDFQHAVQHSKYEIDLHIEKLVNKYQSLSPSEKLNIQLKEFQKALELASVTHQRSIVFIHGVGKGVLKNEIHKILAHKMSTKSIHSYINNYDMRYGYGATEVFFN